MTRPVTQIKCYNEMEVIFQQGIRGIKNQTSENIHLKPGLKKNKLIFYRRSKKPINDL